MKTEATTKLECLRVAMILASAKAIKPGEVVGYAMQFFKWVNGGTGSARDISGDSVDNSQLEKLREQYQR